MKAPNEQIYGRSLNAHGVEKYIQLVTMLSLTIWVYLRSFSSCCFPLFPNPQNSPKIQTHSRSQSSRVIDLGANQKCICSFLLAIYSNFIRISHRFCHRSRSCVLKQSVTERICYKLEMVQCCENVQLVLDLHACS